MFLTKGLSKLMLTLRSSIVGLIVAVMLVTAGGCRRDMQDQPRYEAYESSDFFKDGLASRQPPKNTVPRGFLRDDTLRFTGKLQNVSQTSGQAGAQRSQQGAGSGQQAGGDARQTGGLAPTVSTGTQRPSDNPQPTGSSAAQTPAQVDANLATTFPFPITQQDLGEGQRWFNRMCSMCHGRTGMGDGMVGRRGFRKPTS